jgi:Fe-S-cluster containining protein
MKTSTALPIVKNKTLNKRLVKKHLLIKDINDIKRISARNESRNWDFRSFLKMQDGDRTDEIVKPIYEFVVANISCRECGNCCRKAQPQLTDSDIRELALKLDVTISEIHEKYVEPDEFNDLRLKGLPCVFLQGNECEVYDCRPTDCKDYPHIHKQEFTTRLMGIIENASICPIVFNVFEELKIKMKYR